MTYFTPKVHYNPNVQLITAPNKNVQSYFMKNETSFFVKEEDKITDPQDIITVVITTNEIIVSADKTIILTCNKHRYDNIGEESIDTTILEDDLFFKTLFCLGNFNTKNTLEFLLDYLQCKLMASFDIKWRNRLVNVVFNDLFNRTELIGLVNMFIRYMNVKGIMLTPYSLAVCFGHNLSSASVFYKHEDYLSVGFVDDYTYLYGNILTLKNTRSIDEEHIKDEKKHLVSDEGSQQRTNEIRDQDHINCDIRKYSNEETEGNYERSSVTSNFTTLNQQKNCEDDTNETTNCNITTGSTANFVHEPSDKFFSYDSIDFVEEFARQSVGIGKKTYYCHFCTYKIESVDYITDHIKSVHGNDLSEDFEDVINDYYTEKRQDIELKSDDPGRNYKDILKFIGGEKENKLAINKVFLGMESGECFRSEGDKIIKCDWLTCLKGMDAFLSIECSKELWMSEKEWMTVGLRVLKEKLLFYI